MLIPDGHMTLTLNTPFYPNNPVSWVEAIMALLGRMGGKKLAQVSGRQAGSTEALLSGFTSFAL